jgi:hypothetical protein
VHHSYELDSAVEDACSAVAHSSSSDARRGCTTCRLVVIPGYCPVLRVRALVRWTAYVANIMVATTSGQDRSMHTCTTGQAYIGDHEDDMDLFARHIMQIFTKMTCDGCVSICFLV